MEAENEEPLSFRVDDHEHERRLEPDADSQSIVQVELPPWAEAYEISATEVDGKAHCHD